MRPYMAAILAIAFLESFSVSIIRETMASQTMARSSCIPLQSTEINIRRIIDYIEQTRPVKAVILITRRGVKICVPHNLPWVKETIKKLKQKKTSKQKKITRPIAATS
ncbi:cytokine SCM-1 beta [Anolis carolinensis]|uniref:cytokine SCM-1 beta n=1 Tax=Anolis carolinensis TaxID=28377 RepID=UPI002F2B2C6E